MYFIMKQFFSLSQFVLKILPFSCTKSVLQNALWNIGSKRFRHQIFIPSVLYLQIKLNWFLCKLVFTRLKLKKHLQLLQISNSKKHSHKNESSS